MDNVCVILKFIFYFFFNKERFNSILYFYFFLKSIHSCSKIGNGNVIVLALEVLMFILNLQSEYNATDIKYMLTLSTKVRIYLTQMVLKKTIILNKYYFLSPFSFVTFGS